MTCVLAEIGVQSYQNSISETNALAHETHVNSWVPAAYMSYMIQTLPFVSLTEFIHILNLRVAHVNGSVFHGRRVPPPAAPAAPAPGSEAPGPSRRIPHNQDTQLYFRLDCTRCGGGSRMRKSGVSGPGKDGRRADLLNTHGVTPGPHRTRQRCSCPVSDRPSASWPVPSRQNRPPVPLEVLYWSYIYHWRCLFRTAIRYSSYTYLSKH